MEERATAARNGTDLSTIGIPAFIDGARDALSALERLGLKWQATRFARYLHHLEELRAMSFPGPFPWSGDLDKQKLFFEAANQCHQLVDSMSVWQASAPERASTRLVRVLKGTPLPPDDHQKSDDARNVLFELASAAALKRSGFAVEFPVGDEDLRATYPGLPTFLVECKRPVRIESLRKNLNAARHQLEKRRRPENDLGLVVIGVDRLLGLSGKTPGADTEAGVRATIDRKLLEISDLVRALTNTGERPMFPHASIGGLLLVGAIFLADRGALFTISLMRLFCTGDQAHPISRQIIDAFQPDMEMSERRV